MSKLLIFVGATLATVVSAQFGIQRGTLVVSIVSQKSDYVVLAAKSHNSFVGYQVSGQSDNDACKIIRLGPNTLFFESGASVVGTLRGKLWDSNSAAREAFRDSQKHDAAALSI